MLESSVSLEPECRFAGGGLFGRGGFLRGTGRGANLVPHAGLLPNPLSQVGVQNPLSQVMAR